VVAATTKMAAKAMATATASDDGDGNGDGDGGGLGWQCRQMCLSATPLK